MTPKAPILFLLALSACAGAKSDSTGSPPTEVCFSGADDDGDGLLDCEDPDCTDVCVETECDDGLDQDDDGLVDCADEDCWGNGCPHTRVTLEQVSGAVLQRSESVGTCSYDGPEGSLRLLQPSGRILWFPVFGEQQTCTWQADSSAIDLTSTYAPMHTTNPVTQVGLVLSPDCGWSGSRVAPDSWQVGDAQSPLRSTDPRTGNTLFRPSVNAGSFWWGVPDSQWGQGGFTSSTVGTCFTQTTGSSASWSSPLLGSWAP